MTLSSSSKALETAILTNLSIRTLYRGDILFPCIPAAMGAYATHLDRMLQNFGRGFSPEEQDSVRTLLQTTAQQGFEQSPNAQVAFRYEVRGTAQLGKTLACQVSLVLPTLSDQYAQWYQQEQTQLFGQHPDAKVMNIAQQFSPGARILDLGAGYGRNALPLARLGHSVEALEMTAEFLQALQTQAQTEGLSLDLRLADLFTASVVLAANSYNLILLSEVLSHFRRPQQLRDLFIKASPALQEGGYLLCNCFLAEPGYQPDAMAREMAQIAWSALFTRAEIQEAIAELPLTLISDESAVEYEQNHLLPQQWPPTDWFVDWATGKSTFPYLEEGSPPMELRWLLFQKTR
ncbi:class I SAM-dependent methyltransferase [Lyngbya confervoides]|uniref:Class I SAM-dependent methyltransferase n=1 Tax=Lyngbya confervoides BDU141951 TaxID=1574623 RepID=A0ABD4T081_9CYAN|nr:class I SAM-dependent methyltransferase [Lyngbya confervoides]MCM1982023.1 class I SAM-dependent methyltransferase [Lyngbya confervoides BDU141951]